MDIIVLLVLIILILLFFRDTSVIIYFIGTLDVLLKLIHYIKNLINIPEFNKFVQLYIPNGINGIIEKSTSGLLTIILKWGYIVLIIWFIYYLIKYILRLR